MTEPPKRTSTTLDNTQCQKSTDIRQKPESSGDTCTYRSKVLHGHGNFLCKFSIFEYLQDLFRFTTVKADHSLKLRKISLEHRETANFVCRA